MNASPTYQLFTDQIQDLKSILAKKGVGDCIDELKKYIPAYSKKYDLLILLSNSYTETRSDQVKGILSNEEEDRALNKLADRVLNFISHIEEKDFEEPLKEQSSDDPRIGKVKYFIPSKMQIQEESECKIWIAFDEKAILEEAGEEQGEIKDIRISNVMGVELLDHKKGDAFSIETYDDAEQLIEEGLATSWTFYVTPLLEGKYPLVLKISIIIAVDGEKINKTKVLREIVQITSTPPDLKEGEKKEKMAKGIVFLAPQEAAANSEVVDSGRSIPPPAPVPGPKETIGGGIAMGKALLGALGVLVVAGIGYMNMDSGGGSIDNWKHVAISKDTTLLKKYIDENPSGEHFEEAKNLLAEERMKNNERKDPMVNEPPENELNPTPPEDEGLVNNPSDNNRPGANQRDNDPRPANPNSDSNVSRGNTNKEAPDQGNEENNGKKESVRKVEAFENVAHVPIHEDCEKKQTESKRHDCTKDEIRTFVDSKLSKHPGAIEGKATITFIIDTKGIVRQLNIESTSNYALANEIMKILVRLPKFTPGQNANGEKVNVKYTFPVKFKRN